MPESMAIVNGVIEPETEVQISVNSFSAALGMIAFEAFRAYNTSKGYVTFRLDDHLERLRLSLAGLGTTLPMDAEDVRQGISTLIDRLDTPPANLYLKIMVYWPTVLAGTSLIDMASLPCHWAIFARETSEEALNAVERVSCGISSWRRTPDTAAPGGAKISANYYNARLALAPAIRAGYSNAIMLDDNGFVAEAAESNVFVIRGDVLSTPPTSAPILAGITRSTVLTLASETLGWCVEERPIRVSDLYGADAVVLTNTAKLVRQVDSLNGSSISQRSSGGGPAETLLATYLEAARGSSNSNRRWTKPLSE